MTTTSTPFGLRPARMRGHAPNSQGGGRYLIQNGYNTDIGFGDPVEYSVSGTITRYATLVSFAQGVFLGCKFVNPTTKQPQWSKYFPAGTSSADGVIEAYVDDNPDSIFWIQADSSVSQGDVGRNFECSRGGVNTFTGMSGYMLRPATRTTGAALLRLVNVVDRPDNALTDAFPIVAVQIVMHQSTRTSVA